MTYTKKGVDDEHGLFELLEMLSKHNPWLKPKRLQFPNSHTKYLGLIVNHNKRIHNASMILLAA